MIHKSPGDATTNAIQFLALIRPMVPETIALGNTKTRRAFHLATPPGLIAESTTRISIKGRLVLGNAQAMQSLL